MDTNLQTTKDLKILHESAMRSADAAVDYARQAGEILLAVKKEIPHGQFTAWIENLGFLELRQAQRYMAVASGKPYTIGGRPIKNDAASFLKDMAQENSSGKWIPVTGHWYCFSNDDAAFWVVPWDENETFFHISKFYKNGEISAEEEDLFEEVSFYSGTRSPIPASLVDRRLQYYGLENPMQAEWHKRKKPGIARPFGEPDNYFERILEEIRSKVNICDTQQ